MKNKNKPGIFIITLLLLSSFAYADDIDSAEITDVYTVENQDLFSIFSSLFFLGGGKGYTAGATASVTGDINEAYNVKCSSVRVVVDIITPAGAKGSVMDKVIPLKTTQSVNTYLKNKPIKYNGKLKISPTLTPNAYGSWLGKAHLDCTEDKATFLAKNKGYNQAQYPRISGYTQSQFMVVVPPDPNRKVGGCVINNKCEGGYETPETCPKDCAVKAKECDINEIKTAGGQCVARKDTKEDSSDETGEGSETGTIASIQYDTFIAMKSTGEFERIAIRLVQGPIPLSDAVKGLSLELTPYLCDSDSQCIGSDSTCVRKSTFESAKAGKSKPIFSVLPPTEDEQISILNEDLDRQTLDGITIVLSMANKNGVCVRDFPSTRVDGQGTGSSGKTGKAVTIYEEDLEESTAQKLRDAVCSYDGDCSAVNDDTKRVVCKDVPELRKLYGEKTSTKITDIIKGAINSFKEEEQPSGICIAVDKEEQKSDFLRSIGKIFLPNGSAEQQNQAGIFALIGLFLILVIFMRK